MILLKALIESFVTCDTKLCLRHTVVVTDETMNVSFFGTELANFFGICSVQSSHQSFEINKD